MRCRGERRGPDTTEILRCSRGRCAGRLVSGTLSFAAGEVQAKLARSGRVVAPASPLTSEDRRGALAVRRALSPGRYTVTLAYDHRRVSRQLTIR